MTTPFPSPLPNLLNFDFILQTSLTTAIGEALVQFPVMGNAISFVAINETDSSKEFKHAGTFPTNEVNFFTASLVKVGVLYAAYELRKSVNNLATVLGITTLNTLIERLKSDFDKEIMENFRNILTKLKPEIKGDFGSAITAPKYQDIFKVNPLNTGNLSFTFSDQFNTNLRKMIIEGYNESAGACIKALSYSWINGALHAAGFFDLDQQKGIWVGGTFTGALPIINIPTRNDANAAQVSTCSHMANLYAHLVQGSLVSPSDSDEMLNLLWESAATGNDPSFLDYTRRKNFPPRNYGVTHTKIGYGKLKTGIFVASEGTIVEDLKTQKKFIVVFQNSLDNDEAITGLQFIVERTIELFLKSRFQPHTRVNPPVQFENVRVPNLIGMPGRQSNNLLLSIGLNPNNNVVKSTAEFEQEIVLRQSPEPYQVVLQGSNVDIYYDYDVNGILWKPPLKMIHPYISR